MYISSYNTYINTVQPFANKQSSTPQTQVQNSFHDLLLQQQQVYTLTKSFPVDYINKESTLFNQLRMQTPSDPAISQTLQESLHVSSFDILKKRTESYSSYLGNSKSSYKYSTPLSVSLGKSEFTVQKQNIANIYLANDSYFNKVKVQ